MTSIESKPQSASDRALVGQALHQAEVAIGACRRSVIDLQATESINVEAIALDQRGIYEARIARNILRSQLEVTKCHEPVTWNAWLR